MLQADAYAAAASPGLPGSEPAGGASNSAVVAIRTTLLDLFDLGPTGVDLRKPLADVSNIYQAVSDLSTLHIDSLNGSPPGFLQGLLDDLQT